MVGSSLAASSERVNVSVKVLYLFCKLVKNASSQAPDFCFAPLMCSAISLAAAVISFLKSAAVDVFISALDWTASACTEVSPVSLSLTVPPVVVC